MPIKLAFDEGTLHWPISFSPQASMVPLDRKPNVCSPPAETATKSVLDAGTGIFPNMSCPQATTIALPTFLQDARRVRVVSIVTTSGLTISCPDGTSPVQPEN